MSVLSARIAAISVVLAALGMTACSTSTARVVRPELDVYWSAAKETYAAGDYMKTADHLERLIGDDNQYTDRAIPWYLVVTSGMAAGHKEIADHYAAQARLHKSVAASFHVKASAHRTMASQMALRVAQNADKLRLVPLGPLPLAFALPKGSAVEPELYSSDPESAEALAVEHAVLMAACQAAGAPNDPAQAREILARVPAQVSRATFGKAIADMLEAQSALYSRNQLDEPAKLEAVRDRIQMLRTEAARQGNAKIIAAVH